MKENKYDNEIFFQKYSQMLRSQKGLQGAGEWSELEKILPDFCGKTVLDLGCGYGWHCKYAAEHKAASVLGTDISHRMLQKAQEINSAPQIQYQCAAMEDLQFPPETFDIVLSSLAFHYVKDFRPLAENIARWLKKGGHLVFSVEHPIFTAYGDQDWYYDQEGNPIHWPVDRYFAEGKRTAIFLGEEVVKYHKTLTTYINGLLQTGFEICELIEPQPDERLLDTIPGIKDELRRPMMLLISAKKKSKDAKL